MEIPQMENNELFENLKETYVSREEIFKGHIVHLVRDTVELPNGEPAKREVCLHNGAVCVVPVTDGGEIIMERQFRYPFGEVIWEIPAGKLDSPSEDVLEAAKRELREETGYSAEKFTFIGNLYPSPAILSEKIAMFLATGLHKGEQELDEDEFLDVVKLPFSEVVDMILAGKIPDAKTQTAILKAKLILGI
jgi:ADP-ribose pyrophosphatase